MYELVLSFNFPLFIIQFQLHQFPMSYKRYNHMESVSNLKKPDFQGIDITFRNVSYSVEVPQKVGNFTTPCISSTIRKELLKSVTGIFKAGEVTAIMGTSGAGKTTLLNVLAGRISMKNQEGEIRANDMEYSYGQFGDFANYVMQNDIFMQTLTVRETLRFAADLKLDAGDKVKEDVIMQLSKSLKLEGCMDTLMGGPMVKGVSGGERKRTSIAFELISDPQVLMLDQPTSGLDSLTSFIIVRHLSDLARTRNKTIAMTIHQPNSEIFNLFDRLLLMVEGRLIFQGTADSATAYFAKQFNLVCPEFHNPADFFMSIMHHEQLANEERYPRYFSAYDSHFSADIEAQIQSRSKADFEKRLVKVGCTTAFCTLLMRDIKNIIRNPLMIKTRLFQTIVLSIYAGGLYCKFGPSYTDTINFHALTGYCFFLSFNAVFTALTPVALTFPLERTVFLKEESAKLYGPTEYFMSKNTVELPYAVFFPALQSLIMYWFVGLSSTPEQFFTFFFIIFLSNLCGMSIGLLAGSLTADPKDANGISMLILIPFLIFSGLFKNQANLPAWIGWIQYISPFKYNFSALMQNETLYKDSNIRLLNLDVGLWGSIAILAGFGIAVRLLSLFFLWKHKAKLE